MQTYLFFSSLFSDWVLGPATGAVVDDVVEAIIQLTTVEGRRVSQCVVARL
jgi:hypothetical protein